MCLAECSTTCSAVCSVQRNVQCNVQCTYSGLGKSTWKQGAGSYQLLLLPEGTRSTTARPGAGGDLAKGVLDQLLCCIHAPSSIKVSHHI